MRRIETLAVALWFAGLVGLVGTGDLGARETIVFDPSPREREETRPERESTSLAPEKRVSWSLTAQGDRTAELEGEGYANILGGWVGGHLASEDGEEVLTFFAESGSDALAHLLFGETDEVMRYPAGFVLRPDDIKASPQSIRSRLHI